MAERTSNDKDRKRLDSTLESEGAEFLVLGALLIEGIATYKTYAGYDLVATDPQRNRVARIQVKCRWATDFDRGFLIKNFDCDFVVFVALNRGHRRRAVKSSSEGRRSPEFYVLPVDVVQKALIKNSPWSKASLKLIENVEQFKDAWGSVREFLKSDKAQKVDK
jgi:hypothetical protein